MAVSLGGLPAVSASSYLDLSTVLKKAFSRGAVCMVLPEAGGLKSRICLLPRASTVLECHQITLSVFPLSFSFHPTPFQVPAHLTTYHRVSLSGQGLFPVTAPGSQLWPGSQPAPRSPPPHCRCSKRQSSMAPVQMTNGHPSLATLSLGYNSLSFS